MKFLHLQYGTTKTEELFIAYAHLAIFNKSGLHIEKYWKLESMEHT
jgi:hypothetical protein